MFCAITTPISRSRYDLCILLSFLYPIYIIAFALTQKGYDNNSEIKLQLNRGHKSLWQKILTWPDHARDKSIFFYFFFIYIFIFLY